MLHVWLYHFVAFFMISHLTAPERHAAFTAIDFLASWSSGMTGWRFHGEELDEARLGAFEVWWMLRSEGLHIDRAALLYLPTIPGRLSGTEVHSCLART